MISFCKIHGEYECKEVGVMWKSFLVGCPKCLAEREQKDKEQEIQMKKLLKNEMKLHKEALLLKRGIEPEFFNITLDDYKAETKEEQKALDAAKDLAEGKIKKLVLLGNFGTGKTMLASALAIMLGGIRITMFEISARIREMYNNREGTEVDVLDELLKYPFIAIDEIGRTKGSEAELNWLSYLIDKAHTRNIKLMLISNKLRANSLPDNEKADCFEQFIPADSTSRLRQNTVIVELFGRDRRAFNADI